MIELDLYARDKGLEDKAGGYVQNQKSAIVSVDAFCVSLKTSDAPTIQGVIELIQNGADVIWPMTVFFNELYYLVWG